MKHPLASLFVILFLVSVSVSGGELRTEDVQPPPWAGQYRYDGAGNIKAIGTNQYVYDGAGRLITATMTAGVKAYTYDEFGNLVRVISNGDSAHATAAAVNRATNRIDDATACPPGTPCILFSFDAAGNQTTGPAGAQYQYDPLNMMTELSAAARHDIYIYDADDQRIATVNDAGAASRVWHYTLRDGGASVIREWDDSVSGTTHTWTWTKDYVHRGTSLLATLTPSETSEIRTHFHLDHLGTPRLLTDDLGRKVSIHTYWPFGEETPDSDQDAEARKFTGHERDFAGLGNGNDLDYMHARFYGPAMGRFLSADPVLGAPSSPQSWNRYSYASNNPMTRTDPDGRCGVLTSSSKRCPLNDEHRFSDVRAMGRHVYRSFMALINGSEHTQTHALSVTAPVGAVAVTASAKITPTARAGYNVKTEGGVKATAAGNDLVSATGTANYEVHPDEPTVVTNDYSAGGPEKATATIGPPDDGKVHLKGTYTLTGAFDVAFDTAAVQQAGHELYEALKHAAGAWFESTNLQEYKKQE